MKIMVNANMELWKVTFSWKPFSFTWKMLRANAPQRKREKRNQMIRTYISTGCVFQNQQAYTQNLSKCGSEKIFKFFAKICRL